LVWETLIEGPTSSSGKPIMPLQVQRRNVQFDLWEARGRENEVGAISRP
jgi:hypothetical protein